jgi:hypothetical protein
VACLASLAADVAGSIGRRAPAQSRGNRQQPEDETKGDGPKAVP